jgi:hypothetical protein
MRLPWAEHDSDHREADESDDGARVALEVARQAAVVADPCERALDDSAFGQDDELVQVVALDDFDNPPTGAGRGVRDAWSLVAGIGEDALDEGKEAARSLIENQPRPVAILHVRRMNGDVQEQAERIDEDVPLAARDLLARIIALRVERGAPF